MRDILRFIFASLFFLLLCAVAHIHAMHNGDQVLNNILDVYETTTSPQPASFPSPNTPPPIIPDPPDQPPSSSSSSLRKSHPSKGKVKCKPSDEKKKFKCTHLNCKHGDYGDEEAKYTTKEQLQAHERIGLEHPCSQEDKCPTCKKYREDGSLKEIPLLVF